MEEVIVTDAVEDIIQDHQLEIQDMMIEISSQILIIIIEEEIQLEFLDIN